MNNIIDEDIRNICSENLPWEQLKNKKVLITGANGYLASYIVYTLLYRNEIYNDNIIVYALCRNREKSENHFAEYLNRKDFHIVCQDVCDDIDDKYKSDIIIHAASPASPYINECNPYAIIEANVIAYNNILKKYIEWDSSEILYFSSGKVYGDNTSCNGVDESFRAIVDFVDYKSCYILSKQMCEMMTASIMKENNKYNIKIVRPFIVYGPGQCVSQKKYFTDFLKDFLCEKDIVLRSSGKQLRSHIYLKDAIKGIFYVLLKGENGEAYNILSTRSNYTIKDIAKKFCSFNKKINIIKEDSKTEYLLSKSLIFIGKNDKLKSLGWKDETNIEVGIERTICWARNSDFLEK